MLNRKFNTLFSFLLPIILGISVTVALSQQVKNVPKAFESLSTEPESMFISNEITIPTKGGHLQGVQYIEQKGKAKLLISGSSLTQAYILQVDLASQKTDKLITLMTQPYRHAGGFQVSNPYLAVGVEDNFTKTTSKVCLYNYDEANLYNAQPNMIIERTGEVKQQTAGSTGLLIFNNTYLMVVTNWDSRDWDFYTIDPEKKESKLLQRFTAPDDWPSYQSINLIKDKGAIYAIGFYQKEQIGYGDLILISKVKAFSPVMNKVFTKAFNCKDTIDFDAAVGLQVDKEGELHIWATQKDALRQIVVNRFSPK
jgi:hypothetical protein